MRGRSGAMAIGRLLLAAEADGLAADRIVLPERVPGPVVRHQDPREVRVALDPDAHHVPGLALVPVGGRPDGDDARHRLAVVQPDLDAHPRRALPDGEQVVVDGEPLRLRRRQRLEALRRGPVDVAAAAGGDVAGDAGLPPAEVVDGGDVREKVEPSLVAEVEARVDEARRIDDECRLAVGLPHLDEARYAVPAQEATPRTSYAGGIPATTRSCSRTIP